MAFEIEQKSNTSNLIKIGGVVLTVFIVMGGLWLVFLSKPPIEEKTVPTALIRVNQLSQINLNLGQFNNDPIYRSLRLLVDEIIVEEKGRENPFAPF